MKFQLEPIEPSWDEMISLATQHWMETEMYRHGQQFNPAKERYIQYERMGCLFHFTARDNGQMVGYSIMYLMPSMHTQRLVTTEDTWFLLPEYRKGWNAIKFLRFVEKYMVGLGAEEITMSAKLTNSAGRIMECLDYKGVSMQYSKQLGRADSAQESTRNAVEDTSDVCTISTAAA